MPQCAVLNCNNTHRKTKGASVRYHRFPGDPTTRSQWLRACGRQVQNCATARICSRHFTDTSYERDVQHELLGLPTRCRLKKGALPEIDLPNNVHISPNGKQEDGGSSANNSNSSSSSIAVLLAVGLVPTLGSLERNCGGGLPGEYLNKMHVMEDVREGSDVPGAQPSSPGHAEYSNNNNTKENDKQDVENEEEQEEDVHREPPITAKNKTTVEEKDDVEEAAVKEHHADDKKVQDNEETVTNSNDDESASPPPPPEKEIESAPEDAGSNDSAELEEETGQYAKRKLDGSSCNGSSKSKRLKSELERGYMIRDKILNEYMDATGCCSTTSVQQIQFQMDQIVSEIRTLNELAKEKEKEWNNIIHLKKIKEELLLRVQRRKQIVLLSNIEQDRDTTSPEPQQQQQQLMEEIRLRQGKQRNALDAIFLTSQGSSSRISGSGSDANKQKNSISNKQFSGAVIEINGQSGDPKQNRQRPTLDVQTIIADYRQRHPEVVPRRGRRIRSLLNSQGGSMKQGNGGTAIDANSELSLLLTAAVDNAKNSGSKSTFDNQQQQQQNNIETTSFKDVLMQFAKLSKHERQDLLQSAMKPPPYSEVTVHPVPVNTQSSSNSLLHGILTKTQSSRSDNKSTFSPTLARLLTAPERAAAAGSPHSTNNHTTVTPVSISDMLSNNKTRNEITITPVGGKFDLGIKEKSGNGQDEEEAEDSADKLVIDESEMLDARNRMDNGSDDAGDEVPQCQGCNQKPAQFVCAGCGNQWYCSRECQVVAWDEHSEVCSG